MRGEFVLYHDGQFWVGVLTLSEAGRTPSARVVFGAEPSDAELYDHLLRHGDELLRAAEAAPWVPAWTARPPSPTPSGWPAKRRKRPERWACRPPRRKRCGLRRKPVGDSGRDVPASSGKPRPNTSGSCAAPRRRRSIAGGERRPRGDGRVAGHDPRCP